MKIFHIIDSGGLYGAEMMLLYLMEEQKNMGMQPILCSIGEKNNPEKPLETEAIKRGLTLKKFRMRNGPNFIGAWKILKYAHLEHCCILHTHGYKANILFGFMPKSIRKVPLVSTLHGWTSTNGLSKMRLYEIADVNSLKHFDAVIAVNKNMLNNLKLKNSLFLISIPNGIPLLNFTQDALCNEILDFCRNGFLVGSIGRLSKEKGYEYLLEAFHLLKNKHSDSKLLIIGEGPQRPHLQRKIVQMGLADRVLLPGYQKNSYNYLPLFNVFALSSLTEGFPITLLEAMQAKIPIVATKVGGIPELLQEGKGGLLVDPGNPAMLAEAINTIYNNKQATDLVSRSYHEITTNFTSKKMAENYLQLYNSVLKPY